jgi:RNA polymerase sigma-70 factor, ECF subfamily
LADPSSLDRPADAAPSGGTSEAFEPRRPEQPHDELIARAAAGDDTAFAALYIDLQPRLRRYALSLVGQEADDVTAEAWLQIARDLRGFSGDLDAFRGWAARIVRNRALDYVRARNRRPVQSLPPEQFPELPAGDDTAASAFDRLSTTAAVRVIASLPREQAEAVLLRAVVGLDAKTAGKVLGKSAAAVRVSAHRGLKALAKRLGDDTARDTARDVDGGRE